MNKDSTIEGIQKISHHLTQFLKRSSVSFIKLTLQKPLPPLKEEDLEFGPLEKKVLIHKRAIDSAIQEI